MKFKIKRGIQGQTILAAFWGLAAVLGLVRTSAGIPGIPGRPPSAWRKADFTRTHYRNARIKVRAQPGSATLHATVTNGGRSRLWLSRAGLAAWPVYVFDARGSPVAPTPGYHRAQQRAFKLEGLYPLQAGASASAAIAVGRCRVLSANGVFYVYVAQRISAILPPTGHRNLGWNSAVLRSPILRLKMVDGSARSWAVVRSVPIPKPASNAMSATAAPPPYPAYRVPTGGPIAVLARIAAAVRRDDLSAVRSLCYRSGHATEPFYVAFAERAIAAARCTAAVEKKFGTDPWPRMVPSPDCFEHIVARLDPHSLRIGRGKARVGVLWYRSGRFVPYPSFAYHFRRVGGHWLLDSWATQASVPPFSARFYRLNVGNSLRYAAVFDGLTRDLRAGRFPTLQAFKAAASRKLGAVADWFMLRSMKGNKRWMKANARLVKMIEKEEKAARVPRGTPRPTPQTRP